MREFIYTAHSGRVVFGRDTLRTAAAEAERLGVERVMVLATPQQEAAAAAAVRALGTRQAGLFAQAAQHTPVEVTVRALEAVAAARADAVLSFGGGSTIGLGKAIALRTDLPQIAVPTTYAGSEVTPVIGETENGVKTTQTTSRVLPEVVIYDVDLTLGLPPALSGTSGINAIAHAAEALYAVNGNPVIDLIAKEGVRLLAGALPRIVQAPDDVEARAAALHGAWLCGTCLAGVGMALHHKLCHTLGGSFGLPHAETHTSVLPHALAYNLPAAPAAAAALAAALDHDDPARALYDLAGRVGAERALGALGLPESAIERATELALGVPYPNPRPLDRAALHDLLRRAWAGEPPGQGGEA